MKKKLLAAVCAAALLLAFSGCSAVSNLLGQGTDGKIGSEMKTEWFTFTVDSAEVVTDYAGYSPASGNVLVDVVVTETNTTSSAQPMGTFDFVLDDPADTEYYQLPLDPLDDTMMPTEFELAAGQTVTYHLLFEVAEDSTDLKLQFTEEYTDSSGSEGTGNTYVVTLGI